MIGRLIRAVLAAVLLVVLLAGIPATLLAIVGNPWPALSGIDLMDQLSAEQLMAALSVAIWALWAQFAVSVAAETVEQVSDVAVSIPATIGSRTVAHYLVGAIVAVTASGGALATAVTPAPAAGAADVVSNAGTTTSQTTGGPATTAATSSAPATAASSTTAAPSTMAEPLRIKRHGESLWAIADRHLGDPHRWTEIRDLNRGRTMTDGAVFTSADRIRVGWELLMPADSTHDQAAPTGHGVDQAQNSDSEASHEVEVDPADTLSQIAADELDDPERWREIWRENRDQRQADGIRFTDPDLIRPGWKLAVPGGETPEPAPGPRSRSGAQRPQAPAQPPAAKQPAPPPLAPTPTPQRPQETAPAPTPTPEETAPGATVPEPDRTPQATDPVAQDPPADASASDDTPGWVTPGLTGAGALLAAAMMLGLQRRRRDQHRSRRPGRLVAIPGPMLDSVEADVVVAGAPNMTVVELVDDVLRRTAVHVTASGARLPHLTAMQVTDAVVRLHLSETADPPPGPWSPVSGREWLLHRADIADLPEGATPLDQAPWPLVVTVGHDHQGAAWLLNLEGSCVGLGGDTEKAADFSRFVAAEIACNPWSRWAGLDLVGVAAEVRPMRPERIRVHESAAAAVSEAIADAVRSVDQLTEPNVDLPTARASDPDLDPWPARLLIAHRSDRPVELAHLVGLLEGHRDRTGIGTLIHALDPATADPTAADAPSPGSPASPEVTVRVHIDRRRRMRIEGIDAELTAVGLTAAEAAGCAALLTHAETADDVAPSDLAGGQAWQSMVTVTGSLREQYRVGRAAGAIEPATSLLPDGDTSYTAAGATTSQDLDALAPKVATGTRQDVLDADPSLDEDLGAWASENTPRPRLRVLGPVTLRATGHARADRRAYYTGLLAFLQTRPHGATSEQIAEAFNLTRERARTSASELRAWLGADDDGEAFLPDARRTPAGRASGVPVYQPQRVLFDMDLFRRLRARGQASGPDGIDDLTAALELVTGEPFDQLGPRPIGWAWMLGAGTAERLDHLMTAAIVDVAHTVVTHGLHAGDVDLAARAAHTATLVAPSSHVAQLDLAAVLDARGHHDQARRLVDDVCNHSDDGGAPAPVPQRTAEVIEARRWLDRDAS